MGMVLTARSLGPLSSWAGAVGSQSWDGAGTACSANSVALSAGASRGHRGPHGVLLPSLACLPQEVLPGAKEAELAGSPILSLRLSLWWGHKRPDHFSCHVLAQWSHLCPLCHQPGSRGFMPDPSPPPRAGSPELGLIHVPPARLTVSFYSVCALVPAPSPLLQA